MSSGGATVVQQLGELLVILPVGPFDLAIQMRGSRTDVDVSDVLRLQMPMKLGLEFGAVVGLYDEDPKRQASEDVVNEADRRGLVAGVEYLEDSDAGAVVDGRELVEAFPAAGNTLEKLHVNLQAMPWLRLFIALPFQSPASMFLVPREPTEAMLAKQAMDS